MLVRSENLELQKLWKHAFANRKYYHLNEPWYSWSIRWWTSGYGCKAIYWWNFDIPATGFFVAIGHKPNTDIFKDFITLDETGYIVNTPRKFKTNVEGVFVSGDAAPRIPSGDYRCWNGLYGCSRCWKILLKNNKIWKF
jgi:hypothetical protein